MSDLHERLARLRAAKGRPLIMGIVNATPDSFFEPSRVPEAREAVRRGLDLAEAGADILDVGGESTRPGSDAVGAEEEIARVLPVVSALAKESGLPVSIDTSKGAVARRARDAGAEILNDVLALRGDAEILAAAAGYPLVVLMHMLGASPKMMQVRPEYGDLVAEISAFLEERTRAFEAAGGDRARVWIDPGIGFGKTVEHNLEILRRLPEFGRSQVPGGGTSSPYGSVGRSGRPVLVGASRKSFIGRILSSDPEGPLPAEARLEGSLAAACRAAQGGAVCVRVHDAAETRRALDTWARIGSPA